MIWAEREWFAERGVDVNNVAFGRWVDKKTHDRWHYQQNPKYNDFREAVIDAEAKASIKMSIGDILEELAKARSIYTVNAGNSICQ